MHQSKRHFWTHRSSIFTVTVNLLAIGPVSTYWLTGQKEGQKRILSNPKVECNGKYHPQWARRIVRLHIPRLSMCPYFVWAVYHLGPVYLTIVQTHYGITISVPGS